MKNLFILFIITCLSLTSCTYNPINTKIVKGSFYDNIDKKTFLSRASHSFNLKENDFIVAATIFKVPQIVQCKIPLSGVDRILYIKIMENQLLNIDRHLIFGQEYLFDENEQELKILIDLPVIYLFKGTIKFHIDILALNSKGKYLKTIKKTIAFNWQPLENNSSNGFSYTKLSNSNIKEKRAIKKIVKEEIQNCDTDRLNKEYKKEIEVFIKQRQNRIRRNDYY